MKSIFAPASIAVVGGGNDLAKPGGRVVANIKLHGFSPLWIVNPKGEPVQGLATFAAVSALPAAPELAILAVPAGQVPAAVRELLQLGTRALIVMSAGFSETDEKGKALEQQLVELVRGAGGTLIGPNSLGVFSPSYFGVFGGPALQPAAGTVDFLSASGSTAAFIIEAGLERGLQVASMVSVGNSASTGIDDILAWQDEHFEEAPVRAKLLYLESLNEPERLLRHARSLHKKGCKVVALKAGTTEVGARAASSHTGAMASSDAAVSALFEKAGIVRVASKSEMVDVAGVLACGGPPRSDDIVIVTHAGGPGILLADELSNQGFRVPELPGALQHALLAGLYPGSSPRNPVDFLASGTAGHLRHIVTTLADQGWLGAMAVIFGSPGLFDVWPVFQEILQAARSLPFPVYPVLPSVRTAAAEAAKFRAAGGFFFTDEVGLARALGSIRRTPGPSAPAGHVQLQDTLVSRVLDEAIARGALQLGPEQVCELLRAAGVKLPADCIVHDSQGALRAAGQLGYPVVMKVVGPVHKTDVNGVRLGVGSAAQVLEAFSALMQVPGAQGVLVQQQVEGLELIVGASREPGFGHLILFGLGGVYTETLRDVVLGLAPLSEEEARRMVRGLRSAALLRGQRGRAGVQEDGLVQLLVRVSALIARHPRIKELDINPLMARGGELLAVDARVTVSA